jgi:hypothetical protein
MSPVFRWLLRGARGAEVCEEFEHEYEKTCEKHHHIVAGLWYLAQLFRPRTWVLALELRSIHRAEEGVAPGARRGALGISWLDVKLGLRMLVKYPGLTCVAVFALAIGIPAGMSPMHIANVQRAPLPVDEGDRILALRYFNVATSRPQAPFPDHLALLREELTSFEAVALTSLQAQYNVISEDGRAAPVQGAAVTPSMFNILRVGPLLGRTLIPADEVIGAPAVVVIGYDLWQSRLEGDPDVVGRTIRVGGLPRTVVGVMPREFRFPYRDHLWLPLRGNVDSGGPLPGRRSTHLAFGRLKDGISSDQAQAEFTAVHARMALEFGDWHARIQPEVVPFTYGLFRLPKGGAQAEPGFF